MRAALVLLLASAFAGCGACEPERAGPLDAAPDRSAVPWQAAAAAAASAASSAAAAVGHPPRLACRAIALDGDVHIEDPADAGVTPVLLQGLVPTDGWLVLGTGARLVAKDPRTTRETTLRGPGRARACVGLTEESWVATGAFESTAGAGESPGAEEWVVTPWGVVRYNAARLAVDVRAREVRVALSSGVAFAWAPEDATALPGDAGPPKRTDDGWLRLEGDVTLRGGAAAAPLEGARAAVTRCQTLGKSAREMSETVLAGGADAGTIEAQVATRRVARAACAVAGLRVAALPPSDKVGALVKALSEGNAAWSGLPTP